MAKSHYFKSEETRIKHREAARLSGAKIGKKYGPQNGKENAKYLIAFSKTEAGREKNRKIGKKHGRMYGIKNFKTWAASPEGKKFHSENLTKQNKTKKARKRAAKLCKKLGKIYGPINSRKTKYHKHHIYLKENSDKTILLTKSQHMRMHILAYQYILEKFGRKEIDSYLRWFKRKFMK